MTQYIDKLHGRSTSIEMRYDLNTTLSHAEQRGSVRSGAREPDRAPCGEYVLTHGVRENREGGSLGY